MDPHGGEPPALSIAYYNDRAMTRLMAHDKIRATPSDDAATLTAYMVT
jgi:hypothetical protein